jgi:predicted transcriptional regulator
MQIYPCQDQNATVGFGDIQAGVAKSKILKIININPMKIVLHSITKNLLDDMSITLSRITDKEGNTVAPTWVDLPASKTGENVEIISNKRSKR